MTKGRGSIPALLKHISFYQRRCFSRKELISCLSKLAWEDNSSLAAADSSLVAEFV